MKYSLGALLLFRRKLGLASGIGCSSGEFLELETQAQLGNWLARMAS